jgi:hypothetical protein
VSDIDLSVFSYELQRRFKADPRFPIVRAKQMYG